MGIKYAVDETSFATWNHPMAYVLGFLFADGAVYSTPYNRGKYVAVNSIDKESIEGIRNFLKSAHPITIAEPTQPNHHTKYILRIGSHGLYESLIKHDLYPSKSLTVRMPFVPKKYLADFIRGYFDGDGCVYIEMAKTKNGQKEFVKRLTTVFTSGSKKFLEELSSLITRDVVKTTMPVYNNRRSFQLRYSTASSIQLFKFLYGGSEKQLYLSRKFAVFKRYFTLRPEKVDSKVRSVIMATWPSG